MGHLPQCVLLTLRQRQHFINHGDLLLGAQLAFRNALVQFAQHAMPQGYRANAPNPASAIERLQQNRLARIAQQGMNAAMPENFMHQHFFSFLPRLEVLAHNVGSPLIEHAMNFIVRNSLLVRFFQYLIRKFGRREYRGYPCITCGLPYTRDSGDKPVDD